MERQKEKGSAIAEEGDGTDEGSAIAKWFTNRDVFITGATGTIGRVLIEKILRSCPNVGKIYVLIREHRNVSPSQRLLKLKDSPIFDNIRQMQNHQELFEKIHLLEGDMANKNCGLSEKHLNYLRENCSVVLHTAACVRFDLSLSYAVINNCKGTLNVLDMVCSFKKIRSFVHTSTTYCHCDETDVEERLYKAPHDPRKIIDLVSWMDPNLLSTIAPKLLKNFPNTYAYSKCLTEQLIAEYKQKLPIAIARPSIVTASYKEPVPGWIDNLQGPTGILMAAGRGVIRTMMCDTSLRADIVPVDMVVNSLLIIAWKTGLEDQKSEIDVYNVTADKDNCLTWAEALELGKKYVLEYPFSVNFWYPGGSPKTNYFTHLFALIFFQFIPALFADLLFVIFRQQPCMIKIQKRVYYGLKVLEYYTTRPWSFANDKLGRLYRDLNGTDKKIFYVEWDEIDPEKYMLNYILGTRKYCSKEDLTTLPVARRRLKMLYIGHILLNLLFGVFLLWLIFSVASRYVVTLYGHHLTSQEVVTDTVVSNLL